MEPRKEPQEVKPLLHGLLALAWSRVNDAGRPSRAVGLAPRPPSSAGTPPRHSPRRRPRAASCAPWLVPTRAGPRPRGPPEPRPEPAVSARRVPASVHARGGWAPGVGSRRRRRSPARRSPPAAAAHLSAHAAPPARPQPPRPERGSALRGRRQRYVRRGGAERGGGAGDGRRGAGTARTRRRHAAARAAHRGLRGRSAGAARARRRGRRTADSGGRLAMGPGRGPPPLLVLLGAALVLAGGAVPAREAGSAAEAEELKSSLTWEPRANDTREEAGLPVAGERETSWRAPGGKVGPVGPEVRPEEALEASAAVTGTAWLEADSPALSGVTAEVGSGDAQALPATTQAPDEALEQSTVPPTTLEATEATGPPSPTTSDKSSPGPQDPKESPLEVWLNLGGSTPDPQGLEPTHPLQGTREPQPASDIIDIDYFEGLDSEGRGADLGGFPGSPGTAENHPDAEGETPSWSLLDLYDDFTPFDESDFYPTTSFYDDLEEEEEEEEDDKDTVGGGDLEDENDPLPTEKPRARPETGQPTSRWHAVPPQHTLGMVPGSSIALRPRPGEPGRDLASSENGTECRSGFVRHNGSCRSVCDLFPSYCHNGGQCYLVENIGAFCRCNTQDYIWHKGMRCESIITDFQVMCVAVGSAALVLLLLFMMTVFFAKKLYLLKTENTKLRRTNKFRTPSELHNDNFSLSTIAEGSHPNVRKLCDTPRLSSPHARALAHYDNVVCQDDPSAPHKIQEVLKSCLKEEESFNIQNSMSPKLEGGKGDPAELEVNCLQNNLT
ncbi:chondroitin sulfate proteoglycan 5 [Ctenodactylus gundi]